MISVWWLIPVLLLGACIGCVLMALCVANGGKDE